MDRDSVDWAGPMPALVTPFDECGTVDAGLLTRNIDLQLANGASGFLVGGCTGEFWAMSMAERKALFAAAAKAVAGRATLLVGTGAISASEAIELTRAAQDCGCDGAVVVPPYFVKLTDDEIYAHYETIVSACDLPLCLYNIPGNAVNALSPALARRLAELDSVVAIKESAGDWNNFYATAQAVGDRLRVFCGPSSLYGVAAVVLGADGVIDCFPNMWLPGGLDLYHAAKQGRMEEARRLQAIGIQLTTLLTSDGRTLYPATKAAMALLGLPGGHLRAPLRPLDGPQLAGLREGLLRLGFRLGEGEAGLRPGEDKAAA